MCCNLVIKRFFHFYVVIYVHLQLIYRIVKVEFFFLKFLKLSSEQKKDLKKKIISKSYYFYDAFFVQ